MEQLCSKCGGELEKRRVKYFVGFTRCLKCEDKWKKEYVRKHKPNKKYYYPPKKEPSKKQKFHYSKTYNK
jgi:RNA polymerase-binding transcription factor DksA